MDSLPRDGLTLLYIGRGKGKTTAAVGLAVRARGWNKRVCFIQFIKEDRWPSGERAALKKLGVEVRVAGRGFVKIMGDRKPFIVHRTAAHRALAVAKRAVRSSRFDVVILDEAVSAVEEKLINQTDVVRLIRSKRPALHLVLTGHRSYPALIRLADLVTDMKKVKHPFDQGRLADQGIDY